MGEDFSLHHGVQTGCEAYPAPYSLDSDGGRGLALTFHLHVVPKFTKA
jgi:hypothetical protein